MGLRGGGGGGGGGGGAAADGITGSVSILANLLSSSSTAKEIVIEYIYNLHILRHIDKYFKIC